MMVKYQCNLCDNSIKKIYDTKKHKVPGFLQCQCGGVMEKVLPEVSTSSVEVVDNGAMARKVELRRDAIQRSKEKGDIYIKNMEDRERVIKKK
jgi:hypothetical protein